MPIPEKLRNELDADEFMHRCGLTGAPYPVWHHAFEYAGKRITERWAIFPLAPERHDRQSPKKSVHNDHTLKEYVQWLCLTRLYGVELSVVYKKYPKMNILKLLRDYENKYKDFAIDSYLKEV